MLVRVSPDATTWIKGISSSSIGSSAPEVGVGVMEGGGAGVGWSDWANTIEPEAKTSSGMKRGINRRLTIYGILTPPGDTLSFFKLNGYYLHHSLPQAVIQ